MLAYVVTAEYKGATFHPQAIAAHAIHIKMKATTNKFIWDVLIFNGISQTTKSFLAATRIPYPKVVNSTQLFALAKTLVGKLVYVTRHGGRLIYEKVPKNVVVLASKRKI